VGASNWVPVCPGSAGEELGVRAPACFDGKVAVIGAAMDNEGSLERVGAAWIFTRSGSTWAQRGAKFRGGAGRGENGRFGASVALSADGKTALIGEDGDNAAWVFRLLARRLRTSPEE